MMNALSLGQVLASEILFGIASATVWWMSGAHRDPASTPLTVSMESERQAA
jgi:hypothetical protein